MQGQGAVLIGSAACEWLARTVTRDGDLALVDPATATPFGAIISADEGAVDAAVAVAARAFAGEWGRALPAERARVLNRLADLVEGDADLLADILTLDVGMPRATAIGFEVAMAARTLRYYAALVLGIEGRHVTLSEPDGAFHAVTTRIPVGVVAAILPWNAPLMLAAWKLGPALAAGCTIVLKPAPEAPLAALRLAELARAAGVPEGVVGCVNGGAAAGEALVRHPLVEAITFTGATATGRAIAGAAGLKRVTLELGGKSPVIVLPSADRDAAIAGAARGIFANAGQVCVAGSRVFAHRSVYEAVARGLAEAALGLRMGSGFDPATDLGPLVSARQQARATGLVEAAVRDGGTLLAGGETRGPGFFLEPTVIAGCPAHSRAQTEEIFAPVVTVQAYDDPEEVVAETNAGPWGLAAYVWGGALAEVHRLAAGLRVGTVFVNTPGFPPPELPTGGLRQSGHGRDLGREGLDAFLETRTTLIRL